MKMHPISRWLPLTLALFSGFALEVCAEPASPDGGASAQPATAKPGEILKLDRNAITVAMPPTDTQRAQPRTYLLDENTQVRVSRLIKEQATSPREITQSFKVEPGRREDLKIGKQVRIESDGDRAFRITIFLTP